MINEISVLKKLRIIMMLFGIFEFGLVIWSVIAICRIDLNSNIEYYGPTITAILVLSSQIYK